MPEYLTNSQVYPQGGWTSFNGVLFKGDNNNNGGSNFYQNPLSATELEIYDNAC